MNRFITLVGSTWEELLQKMNQEHANFDRVIYCGVDDGTYRAIFDVSIQLVMTHEDLSEFDQTEEPITRIYRKNNAA